MKVKYNDFLGLISSTFDTDLYTLSIVDYERKVSEEWHCHKNFHFTAILRGGNLESRRKEDILVSPGKLLIYKPGEIHCNRFTQFPSKNLNLEIKDAFFENHDLTSCSLGVTHFDKIDYYFNLIKIYHELTANDQYTHDTIHTSLKSMFSKKEKLCSKPSWLNKLKEIVEDRWDEFVPLEDLALKIHVHPVTISKYFRKYYDCTLADYMRKIKIEKALYLILNTRKSITEITFICGFSDQSHMTRLFKLYLGFKPKEISRI